MKRCIKIVWNSIALPPPILKFTSVQYKVFLLIHKHFLLKKFKIKKLKGDNTAHYKRLLMIHLGNIKFIGSEKLIQQLQAVIETTESAQYFEYYYLFI